MIDTFTMKDGRKVKVDFTNTKSCLSVKKKDWVEIRAKIILAQKFVESKQFKINVFNRWSGIEVFN